MGEHCGTKLLHHETSVRLDQPCSTCKALETKQRRLAKSQEAIRWRKKNGPREFQHSIARAEQDIRELLEDIAELEARRSSAKVARSRKGCGSEHGIMLPRIEAMASAGGCTGSRHGSGRHSGGW